MELNDIYRTPFKENDKMRELIAKNPYLLPVLSRFDISLGFGESTIAHVCSKHKVDTDTFLTVCNFFSSHETSPDNIKIPELIKYLKSSHNFFLNYVLPEIRTKLITAVSPGAQSDFTWMLIKFYDEYVGEVRRHMAYEEENVFEYVLMLCNGKRSSGFSISQFKENHLPISEKLRDIKELFIGHYSAEHGRVDLLNTVLFDLMVCERDLMLHCALEDKIFIPAVEKLESSVEIMSEKPDNETSDSLSDSTSQIDEEGDIVLTARERDIVRAIAKGLANKEIADKLFLSIHTVTTHRRNISNKLNIHSSSGMTIYALMHGIITLEEAAERI